MYKNFILILCLSLSFGLQGMQPKTIAMVYDGPEQMDLPYFQQIKDQIHDLMDEDFKINIIETAGDWTLQGVKEAIEEAVVNRRNDLVLTAGILANHAAITRTRFPKPIVTTTGLNPFFQEGHKKEEIIPQKNLAYTIGTQSLRNDIELSKLLGDFRNVAIIGDESYISPPDFTQIREVLIKAFQREEMQPSFFPVTNQLLHLIDQLHRNQFDAVIILPTWRVPRETFEQFAHELQIPSFSMVGESEVKLGILATTNSESNFRRFARRIALNIQEFLIYGANATIDPQFPTTQELTINEKTAKRLGIDLSWQALERSRFVDRISPPKDEMLNLTETALLAKEHNRDLDYERYVVRSGAATVQENRSQLLPQLEGSVRNRAIDADRARRLAGAIPQYSVQGALTFTQPIYEENRWAAYDSEKKNQLSRLFDKDTTELDIIRDASIAYIRVLREQALLEIEKENLTLTHANLKYAQDRVESGVARKSEEYRWESEIASNRQRILDLEANIQVAKSEYNRVLYRPMTLPVLLKDIHLFDPIFALQHQIITSYIDSPNDLNRYNQLIMKIARENSTELKSIGWQIQAQVRQWTAAKRAYYLPNVNSFAEVSDLWYRDGAGRNFAPGTRGDHMDVTVGIDINYPLWTSGARKADLDRALNDLRQLQTIHEETTSQVNQRALNAMDNMKASYSGIHFANLSYDAANKNLRIVTDSYQRGVSSIVDLIDAQNTLLDASRLKSDAFYDFFRDFIDLQRALGHYEFLMDKEEKNCFYKRIKHWMATNGE